MDDLSPYPDLEKERWEGKKKEGEKENYRRKVKRWAGVTASTANTKASSRCVAKARDLVFRLPCHSSERQGSPIG